MKGGGISVVIVEYFKNIIVLHITVGETLGCKKTYIESLSSRDSLR